MAEARSTELTIAELARRADVTPRTIRYYVSEGLLPPPGGSGQRRIYGQHHLDRLRAIQHLKASYLPLHEIRRELVAALPHADVNALVSARSAALTSPASPMPSASTGVAAVTASAAPTADLTAQLPFGLGRQPQVGRVEIYEPIESVWHRHTLAPDIELHFRDTADPTLAAVVQRIIAAALAILDDKSSGDPPPASPPSASSR